jgi:hypothetical protein
MIVSKKARAMHHLFLNHTLPHYRPMVEATADAHFRLNQLNEVILLHG